MAYVAIDTRGARELGQALRDTAMRIDTIRREVSVALNLADLDSQVPIQLSVAQDGFTTLGTGVLEKAGLAEKFVESPQQMAQSLGAPVDALSTALTGLLGVAGPSDLRGVLLGLPAPGRDAALDAALARLNPVLFPAFLSGERPELTEAQAADLRVLARALGIEQAGPPVPRLEPSSEDGFLGADRFGLLQRLRPARSDTEVFWNDFWADGRTVADVIADPGKLFDWVAGTFELDRRLAVAPRVPGLGDILASVDFATANSDPGEMNRLIAEAEAQFAAITTYLPQFLIGQTQTPPDATQLAQTLAFAARVGWPDPGTGTSDAARFASAIGFLRANRALGSALLPTGFGGDRNALTFFNAPGIALSLELGRNTGILSDAYLTGLAGFVDQALTTFGIDLSGPNPVQLTEQMQGQFFALVASQIPAALAQSPTIQGQFLAALGYLRQATNGPDLRRRLIEMIAAFRTVAITGAPALTERQLHTIVGPTILDVLGRARLRQRAESAVQKSPEFMMVALQWGRPGGNKQDLGKFKFSWSFDEFGELTAIRRKKKSWLSRAFDTIKSIGKAIVESWKDNPFKAIFQVGKIALGALALVIPGVGLGVASLALSVAETAFHAIEGDWMAAISSGLAAFTAGATDVFGTIPTAVQEFQQQVVNGLVSSDTLEVIKNFKRVFDIGNSVFQATQATSLAGMIGAGIGAVGTTIGAGGQLLGSFEAIDASLTRNLVRIGTTIRDFTGIAVPAVSLINGDTQGLLSLANGLAILSTATRAFSNPLGAGQLLGFSDGARETLKTIAAGTGVAAAMARAIDAADRGEVFRVGSFLAQAIQAVHDPRQTVIGDQAQVVQRIADIGSTLEKLMAVNANPAAARAAAPILLAQLQLLVDDASTPPKLLSAAAAGALSPIPVPVPGVRPPFALGDGGLVTAGGNSEVRVPSPILTGFETGSGFGIGTGGSQVIPMPWSLRPSEVTDWTGSAYAHLGVDWPYRIGLADRPSDGGRSVTIAG